MKLSVVVICWNDLKVIGNCLQSILNETQQIDFEIIVSDNGSTDGSVQHIRKHFSGVRIIENKTNLGFAKGNNAGIRAAQGDYVLILNPDTIIHNRALEKLVIYADRHPEAGAFGCRVLNSDGSLQHTAQPAPTVWRYLIGALCIRWLGKFSDLFLADTYGSWDGRTERPIGFQAGCCLLVRGKLLQKLKGFDSRFFHQYEDADLCHRVWNSGNSVLFFPEAEITHIGGRNRGSYPIRVVLETERSKYRYFHKHNGVKGLVRIRYVSLIAFGLRYMSYGSLRVLTRGQALRDRLELYRMMLNWHWHLNPIRFIERGGEPDVGCEPLASPPKL